jgi:hypothetical protein
VEVKPRRLVMLHERASALRGFAREAVEDTGQQKRFKKCLPSLVLSMSLLPFVSFADYSPSTIAIPSNALESLKHDHRVATNDL